MSLVFAGICSHAPGITGRAQMADQGMREEFYSAYRGMAEALAAARPDALIIVAAEHFANFFMNNMPAFAVGMADSYEGPIEDPQWLGIPRVTVPGNAPLSQRLIRDMMQTVDLAYAEEWKFDHGIMVPLNFLTPRYDLPVIPMNINCQGPPLGPLAPGLGARRGAAPRGGLGPERIALVGTGGISHWPATPDSGKINEPWDREFLRRWQVNDKAAMLSYTDEATYREAGQGGFEIRTFISVAAAAGGRGTLQYYRPIPIFCRGLHRRHHEYRRLRFAMSHMTLEYSANLRDGGRLRRAVPRARAIHGGAAASTAPRCFRRAECACAPFPARTYCIADGTLHDAGFVHAILKIGAGRSDGRQAGHSAAACSTS